MKRDLQGSRQGVINGHLEAELKEIKEKETEVAKKKASLIAKKLNTIFEIKRTIKNNDPCTFEICDEKTTQV